MNPLQKEPNKKHEPPTEAEIEQMMREQGVERFDFDAAVGEGGDLWTDEEFEEFLVWLREERRDSNRRKEKID
ncbi:MAG TPA: hypothetical protein VF648_11150 [Pyrinomonadaceae bacterium]|jgi:hypothetical protein